MMYLSTPHAYKQNREAILHSIVFSYRTHTNKVLGGFPERTHSLLGWKGQERTPSGIGPRETTDCSGGGNQLERN